ncbi:putative membrane protein [Halalkaliarchaeum sp. AArc-CO]|uniref:DUF7139 domain-containing protein n=1 Tax=unclassified Halalkaliarchaeum TaxID=2678344 RepID=UPI00217D2578|nr:MULTISPECIES: ribonuclease BN [unclassified Halalkaliarchaeum]MDR5672698.1 ribonuclease BN [Halalkaliarchaeum sp. AArc-GB]UWG49396.1 putative membrane protein [Halalkaliarchaeum sp. AArc-CO]
MTSLSEAYGDGPGTEVDLRRLYLGIGLFLGGVLLVVAGILAAGTEILTTRGYSLGEARLYGGVLGGLGVPAVFLGIFAVLPASRATRAAATVGAAVAILGVAMFYHAYPCQWIGSNCGEGLADLTLATSSIYFLGTLTTFWCLFVGVANFKRRNDPGGTVTMEVTRKGETKIVEVERGSRGLGGIGFLGSTPDGDVDTQTNRTGGGRSSRSSGPATGPSPTSAPSSDGGAETTGISSPLDTSSPDNTSSTVPSRSNPSRSTQSRSAASTSSSGGTTDSPTNVSNGARKSRGGSSRAGADRASKSTADKYCGSCTQFRYVRTPEGMQPYCDFHDGRMDDMDACEDWTPRGR